MSASSARVTVGGVSISNPDRIVYPELGLTKLDVARHFHAVAKRMLPHVGNRPLSLLRCPDGTAGTCFFQKHWQGRLPEALDTVPVRERSGTKPYVVVRDATGLVTLAQWGVIEVHPWPATADHLEEPDWITFDLDPGPGRTWRDVVSAARELHKLLTALGLAAWPKLTGGKGVHVVVPIRRTVEWDVTSGFARAVAEHLAWQHPDRYISKAEKARRTGRIFIDWLRNTRGATAVAAWSPRARASAGVAVPVTWERLARIKAGDQYTIGKLPTGPEAWTGFRRSARAITEAVLDRLEKLQ